jgi:hypothetical protein
MCNNNSTELTTLVEYSTTPVVKRASLLCLVVNYTCKVIYWIGLLRIKLEKNDKLLIKQQSDGQVIVTREPRHSAE